MDESGPAHRLGARGAVSQRQRDILRLEPPDLRCDETLAKIACLIKVAGARALGSGMIEIDCVSNEGRRGISSRAIASQDGRRISDAAREAASAPATRRDAADRHGGGDY